MLTLVGLGVWLAVTVGIPLTDPKRRTKVLSSEMKTRKIRPLYISITPSWLQVESSTATCINPFAWPAQCERLLGNTLIEVWLLLILFDSRTNHCDGYHTEEPDERPAC